MDALRREVVSPVPAWRRPHALATLCLATLLFMSSLDAMLIAYRLRCEAVWADQVQIELGRSRGRAEVERVIAEQDAFFEAVHRAELAARARNAGEVACKRPLGATVCEAGDPLCGM